MNFALLCCLVMALLASAEVPFCECCGPDGNRHGTAKRRTPCTEDADPNSHVVVSYRKGAPITIRCRVGDYMTTTDHCFVQTDAINVSPDKIVRPCNADEGCRAEEGPLRAFTVRTGPSNCYAEPSVYSQVLRVYEPGAEIQMWCKGGSLYYLTDDRCWIGASKVPFKSTAIPICGSWRPPQ